MALHVGLGRGTAVDTCEASMKARYCPCRSVKGFADIATRSIHLRLSQRRGTMNIRYQVDLSDAERSELQTLLRGGRHAARTLKRAQILLAADAGVPDDTIAQSLGVGGSTVYRTKRRFVEGNIEKALDEEPRPGAARKLTVQEEALLVATACSSPPNGRACWTIELLAGEMVRLTAHESLSRARPCAGGWPRTNSSLGVGRCGACRRSTRVRRAHGGCARSLRRAARSGAPSGVPGRKPRSADWRGARAHPGRARASRAGGLRVPP